MNMPVFCPDSFIVQDIFTALVHEPEKYNIHSLKGLNQLCDLGINLCVKKVKSLRGSYFQAKLIGLCLSTGYYNVHKNKIQENETVFDLIEMLGHMGTHFEKDIKHDAKQLPEDAMRIYLIRGFEDGIRLGRRIYTTQKKFLTVPRDIIQAVQRDLQDNQRQKQPLRVIKQPLKRKMIREKREKLRE